MANRDIVVVGSSAGGVGPLIELVQGLPRDLGASIFIVQHTPPYAVSKLAEILGEAGPLKAKYPLDGELIQPAQIYVAPPDRHLLIIRQQVRQPRSSVLNSEQKPIICLQRLSLTYTLGPQEALGILRD